MDLQDKTCVVTGASSGLGEHFARALVEKGAVVFGLARSRDRLDDVRDQLGERFRPVRCDVREEQSVADAFGHVENEAGRLDVLIGNAGLGQFGAVEELPLEKWDQMMETNVRGLFLCARAAAPVMRRQNEASGFGGHIINIASIAGLVANAEMSGYNASKHAVRGFSKALMQELRGDGIKVSCVYPGSVNTNFRDGPENPLQPDDVAATVMHLLETPDNYLVSEIVMRPLRPSG